MMTGLVDVWPRLNRWWSDRPPAARLTTAYVMVLAVFSLGFSMVLYQFANAEIEEGLRQQYFELHRVQPGVYGLMRGGVRLAPESPAVAAAVQPLADAARSALLLRLGYLNLVVIAIGGLASYWLAKRTVRPIEQALEAQSRFASDASHELRTPLAVMRAEIEVARANPSLSKQQAVALLDSTVEEVGKLQALAEALLRLARSHHQDVPLGPVKLGATAQAALARVAPQAKAAKLRLVNDTHDVSVRADRPSLEELLVILLDNAVKYSPARKAVTLSAVRRGRFVTISVADQGRGIAADDLPHIFDRFYRADTSRSSQDVGGHGLGLSIAWRIAELHGSVLEVESALGKGSVFRLRLPVA
jgi:signal transduction histidine kinase